MVSGSSSESEGSDKGNRAAPFFTYTQRFYEVFPSYLAMGMSPTEFWDGDATLVKYYREAEEIRTERRNQELWLQGMYIYEAICDASPILRSFAKKGTKPIPYTKRPYPVTERQRKKIEEDKARETSEKGKRFFEMLIAQQELKKELKKGENKTPKEGGADSAD